MMANGSDGNGTRFNLNGAWEAIKRQTGPLIVAAIAIVGVNGADLVGMIRNDALSGEQVRQNTAQLEKLNVQKLNTIAQQLNPHALNGQIGNLTQQVNEHDQQIDAMKATSQTRYEEIIQRLTRIEARMNDSRN